MYSLKYYTLSQISKLEDTWRQLEKGQDMTYFQRYDWYKMLSALNIKTRNHKFEITLVEVLKGNQTVMIAPLWIVFKTFGKVNLRGIYFFGRGQWSDYLNFIYYTFDGEAMKALFTDLKQKYGISNFILEEVPTYSATFHFINEGYTHLEDNGTVCVELFIPENIETYHKMLSKSSRQNIRTAFNRAQKDNIEFTFDFDDQSVDLVEFSKYRDIRLVKKNTWKEKTLKWEIINFISTKILRRGQYKFPSYTPFECDQHSHFITCRDQHGNLCAAFNYGIDIVHNQIVLMAVTTNPDFYKYSSGILAIYQFVLKQMEEKGYSRIDFTRGNEKYKYVLGGVEHYNQRLVFDFI